MSKELILPQLFQQKYTHRYFLILQVDSVGTGAGHGAQGGSVSGDDGGDVYDTTQLPYQQGSGGGSSASGTGGAGGGYLKISIFETLTVEGMHFTCFTVDSENFV